jgi:hypothetical protein
VPFDEIIQVGRDLVEMWRWLMYLYVHICPKASSWTIRATYLDI